MFGNKHPAVASRPTGEPWLLPGFAGLSLSEQLFSVSDYLAAAGETPLRIFETLERVRGGGWPRPDREVVSRPPPFAQLLPPRI